MKPNAKPEQKAVQKKQAATLGKGQKPAEPAKKKDAKSAKRR
jgi:hypothetical protein